MRMQHIDQIIAYNRYWHDGFIIEIYEYDQDFEAWLFLEDYSEKELVLSMPKAEIGANCAFTSLVDEHLPDYEEQYKTTYLS